MTQYVQSPDGQTLGFPDDMQMSEIAQVMRQHYPPLPPDSAEIASAASKIGADAQTVEALTKRGVTPEEGNLLSRQAAVIDARNDIHRRMAMGGTVAADGSYQKPQPNIYPTNEELVAHSNLEKSIPSVFTPENLKILAASPLSPDALNRFQEAYRLAARDETGRSYAENHPHSMTLSNLYKGLTFGWAPGMSDEERAGTISYAREHPWAAGVEQAVGQLPSFVVGGEALQAAPVVGKGVSALNNLINRIPAVTSAGRQAAAKAIAEGAAPAATFGTNVTKAALVSAPIGASERMADEGVSLENALWGSATGLAGGAVGSTVLQGAGRVLQPIVQKAAKYLIGEGVKLTPGQTAGGILQEAEQKGTGIPVAGGFVKAPIERSLESFNRVAVQRALTPIEEELPASVGTGHEALDYASDKVSEAYGKAIPSLKVKASVFGEGAGPDIRINGGYNKITGELVTPGIYQDAESLGASDSTLSRIKEVSKGLFARLRRADVDAKGFIKGQALKDAQSYLSEEARDLSSSNNLDDRRAAYFVRRIRDEYQGSLSGDNKGPVLSELKQADEAYRNLRILRSATVRGTGDEGAFTPAQLDRAVKAEDRSPDNRDYASGKALMQDLSSAGKTVFRALPSSGTSERSQFYKWLAALVTGAGAVGGNPAIPAAALALPVATSSLAQRVARNALAGGSSWRTPVGNAISKYGSRYVAPLGSTAAND